MYNSWKFLRILKTSCHADVCKTCKFVFFTVNIIYSVEKSNKVSFLRNTIPYSLCEQTFPDKFSAKAENFLGT